MRHKLQNYLNNVIKDLIKFNLSCMVTVEVDIMYNQTIMKTKKETGVYKF